MKESLRKLCSPILTRFESGEAEFEYRESYRTILIIVGLLCWVLSAGALYGSINASEWGGALPVIVFFVLGFVCEVVALLGNDRAVARIWKSK